MRFWIAILLMALSATVAGLYWLATPERLIQQPLDYWAQYRFTENSGMLSPVWIYGVENRTTWKNEPPTILLRRRWEPR